VLHKRQLWTILAIAVIVALVAGGVLWRQTALASPEPRNAAQPPPIPSGYYWHYAVKFVCGLQDPDPAGAGLGEPVVKPGNYATEINIHNPNYMNANGVVIFKKTVVLVEGSAVRREPEVSGPNGFAEVLLQPDFATLDDCNAIWMMSHPGQPIPPVMPTFIGFLIIFSRVDLDVVAVYTANSWQQPGALPDGGISQDVETVAPKRVRIP
jgi:hypothetical protein